MHTTEELTLEANRYGLVLKPEDFLTSYNNHSFNPDISKFNKVMERLLKLDPEPEISDNALNCAIASAELGWI